MAYLIRDATIADVYALAKTLRAADRAECAGYGVTPQQGLRRSYYAATFRRTALIDGVVAAMWGISGNALGYCGHAWLMTAPAVEQLPLAFLRETRREVATMLSTHRRIEGECALEYVAAQRFLALAGFTFGETIEMPGGTFRKFFMERA